MCDEFYVVLDFLLWDCVLVLETVKQELGLVECAFKSWEGMSGRTSTDKDIINKSR